jgi:hypothetical protein
MVEFIRLKGPNSLAEEAGADEQDEIRHHDEEDGKRWTGLGTLQRIASEWA